MGNNRLPVLSRISPETRDNDFISITELKYFDEQIDLIIKKFNSIETSDNGNIAQQLKDIEYNMADALILDNNGNIIGYKTDDNGDPIYGEDDIKTMLSKLEEYYNKFVMLMGNDPNMDNWKADLNRYYTEAINELNNKINSIFRNSVNMAALEAKEDPKNNYVLDDAKNLTSGSIMRLNPDTSTYIRNINIRITNPGEENVVFDIVEAVKDSFVLNLKLQNGSMYFDFNIVLDKGKIFISNEHVLPEEAIQLINGYIIKIYKFYDEFSDKAHYVFTFSAPVSDIYGFEITGILISNFNFDNSGIEVTSHSKYYKYVLVENEEPNYNETYYFKETDSSLENGKISYIPVEKVTSFDPEKEYYRKERQFFKVKEWDIFNYNYDGNISSNGYLKNNEDQIVVEKTKYNKDLKVIDVDIENDEIINKDLIDYKDQIIKNEQMWNPDDSVRIIHRGIESNKFEILGKGPYKPTNKDIMAFGEVIFEKYDLNPGEIVSLNDCIAENYDRQVQHSTNEKVTITEKTYLKSDFTNTENPVKFVNKVIFNDKDISGIINKYIMDNISFIDKIKIMMYIGNDNPDIIYFYLLPDDCEYDITTINGISEYEFYSFALNLSDKKESVFTFVRPEIKNDILKRPGELWNDSNIDDGIYNCITLVNDGRLVAGSELNTNTGIKYSDDNGITWNDTNITSGEFRCIIVANDGTLVACGVYGSGIKYSDDNGETWKNTNITNGSYQCITLANDGRLLASGGGIKYSDDNGKTWNDSNITSGSYLCITLINNGRLVAGGGDYNGIKYSDDNGITWNNTNITNGTYNCIIVANNGRLVACGKGIIYSDDNGEIWNNSNITSGSNYCIILANNGRLVAGNGYGIKYSDDNGITWNNSNITRGECRFITLANDSRLIASGGIVNTGAGYGIMYSDDNGETWIDSNIDEGWYDCIIVANDDTLVACGSASGIIYSDAIYSHKPITKVYSLPNENINRDVNEKFGHNGYTFAEIPNERLIYSTLDKTFIKNPADDDCLFDYQFVHDSDGITNKVIGVDPINSKIDPLTNETIYKNTSFDNRFDVTEISNGSSNSDIIKSFITSDLFINRDNKLTAVNDSDFSLDNIPDNEDLYIDYGFETDDGVFIVGKINTKDVVCFAPWTTDNSGKIALNFTLGFTADYIDYLRPFNNEIIISSFDSEHDGIRWKFNRDTLAFESNELVNGNTIPSFNNVFEIHGSLYIINGTGKRIVDNPYQGLNKLYKSNANNINNGFFISDMVVNFSLDRVGTKEFFNIPMIKFYENDNEYYLFIYNNIDNKVVRIDFDLYEYIDGNLVKSNLTNISNTSTLNNGYSYSSNIPDSSFCKKINSIVKSEFNEISKSIDYEYVNPDYSIVTQSLNNSFDDITIDSNNEIINNPNLLHEKFYFDKENSYIKFEKFDVNQNNKRFILSSEKIAVGTTLKTNKSNIVINLAKDCKIAVFDKMNECLKTVSLGYTVNLNGRSTVIKLDPNYFMFDNLIIGSENMKNTVYVLVHGKFPTISLDENDEWVFDYNVDLTYKLYSIDIDNIINSENETINAVLENNYTYEGTIPSSESIRNYIKTTKNQIVSKQLELSLVDDIQFIDIVNDLRYENTNSIVFWNTVSNSLDFVTKINIRDKFKTIIELNNKTIEPMDLILCKENNIEIKKLQPNKESTTGELWEDSNDTTGTYFCITVANNGRLIAGSGSNNGIKYSDDNGKTWNNTNISSDKYYCITVANNGRLVAGSYNNQGIKYSDDNGKTWNNTNISDGSYKCITVANNGTLVTCSSNNKGIKYSYNGITWNDSNDTTGYFYCITVANNGRLIAGGVGIKYSDDNGITWNNSSITNDRCICIVLADDGTLVASGDNDNGIKYSDDNGITWNNSSINSDSYLCIIIANNGRLVAGNGYGIKYSDDNGITWNNSNITSDYYYCITLANNGRLIAGSSDNKGIIYSDDNGETWNNSSITSGYYRYISVANDGRLVACGYDSYGSGNGIKYSLYIPTFELNEIDSGTYGNRIPVPYGKKSVEFVSKNKKELENVSYVKDGLMVDDKFISEKKEFNDNVVKIGEILVAGSNNTGIKYSTNNGVTWINSNITRGGYTCIILANNNRLIASGNGIKYSDDGKIWIDSNITDGEYRYITLANDGTLVAGDNYRNGIKYSDDNGKTWNNTNITDSKCYCITVANNNRLVACISSLDFSSFGIIYSDDNGKTWNNSNIINDEYEYRYITLANDGTLVVSIKGYGIKYSDDNGITWNETNITSGSYKCITVANGSTLVASVSEFDDYDGIYGIKYSDDNGKTWNNSNISDGIYSCIILANDGRLVAGSDYDDGIKYSDDNGKTWNSSNITSSINDSSYSCITLANNGNLVVVGKSIKYSDDNGETWKNTNIFASALSDSYNCVTSNIKQTKQKKIITETSIGEIKCNDILKLISQNKLVIDTNNKIIKFIKDTSEGVLFVIKDSNNDVIYKIKNIPNVSKVNINDEKYFEIIGKRKEIADIEDIDGEIVILNKSVSGTIWNDSNINRNVYLCIILANDGRLVAGSYNGNAGIKYSDDNGETWIDSSITSGDYYCITLANDDRLIAGSYGNNGIKYSDDNGETWNNSNITSGYYNCITVTNDGTLVAGGSSNGIKYSIDNGITWNNTNINSGSYLCITLANNGRLVAGSFYYGIKYSDDNGITWNNSNISSSGYSCITLANDGTLVACGSNAYGIKYSDDNGETWTNSNITSDYYYCIVIANNGRLIAGGGSSNGIKYSDMIINNKLIFTNLDDNSKYKIVLNNGNIYNKDNTLLVEGKYNLKDNEIKIINPNIYSKLFKLHILVGENNILIDFNKNIYLPKSTKAISNSVLHTIKLIDERNTSSFDKIAKILFEKGVPLDKTVKVIGSIVYNNIPVSITNLRIVSDNSRTKTPLAIYFSIDKEFRLPNDVFINNEDNFTENNAHGEYDQFVKRGIISNYNIDTNEKITNINNVITKCNFTIICDNQ